MTVSTGSLFTAQNGSALLRATEWLEGTLLGTFATVVAVLAIAGVGLMMLQGRIAVRDGARVLVGCFILFGAVTVANGLRSLSDDASGDRNAGLVSNTSPELSDLPKPSAGYDPYAGASVQN